MLLLQSLLSVALAHDPVAEPATSPDPTNAPPPESPPPADPPTTPAESATDPADAAVPAAPAVPEAASESGAGGVVGGVIGGFPTATSHERQVHMSEVQVKKRVVPKYPAAARELGLGEQSCVVRFHVNERGVPTAVEPRSCPEMFVEESVTAGMKWRWYPFKVNGVATAVQFDINFKYLLK